MLYPLPLNLGYKEPTVRTIKDAVFADFGLDIAPDAICRLTGHIVSREASGLHVLQLSEDNPDCHRRIRAFPFANYISGSFAVAHKTTHQGKDFATLSLEGGSYLISCAEISEDADAQDNADRLHRFAELSALMLKQNTRCTEGFMREIEFVPKGTRQLIKSHAEAPHWVELVLEELCQDVERTIEGIEIVECHGDCHLDNFIVTGNGSIGLLPSSYQGQFPRGYDLATAVWSLLQTHGVQAALDFCSVVASKVRLSLLLTKNLTQLVVLRCIWWLGLRCTWRKIIPFEISSLIERHLEFALNIRVLKRQFQNALTFQKTGALI